MKIWSLPPLEVIAHWRSQNRTLGRTLLKLRLLTAISLSYFFILSASPIKMYFRLKATGCQIKACRDSINFQFKSIRNRGNRGKKKQKAKMENSSPSMATQTAGDISSGNVQQHFSVPSTGAQAVSIVTQDPSKGVYIVDPSQQHTALQMFSEQRLIAAAASSNQVELTSNTTTPVSAQTFVVRSLSVFI